MDYDEANFRGAENDFFESFDTNPLGLLDVDPAALINTIFLELTDKCNLNCSHCGAVREGNTDFSYDLLVKLRDDIKKNFPNVRVFSLTGGEPLMYSRLLDAVRLLSKDFYLRMFTNGCLVDRKVIDSLKKAGLTHTLTSVDGPEKIHDKIRGVKGSYKKTLNGIKIMEDASFRIGVRMTLTKGNIDHVREVAEVLSQFELNEFSVRRMTPVDKEAEKITVSNEEYISAIRALNDFSKDHKNLKIVNRDNIIDDDSIKGVLDKHMVTKDKLAYCVAGITSVHITNEGKVIPCYIWDDVVGDLNEQPLSEIVRNNKLLKTIKRKRFEKNAFSANCEKFIMRCGGCRVRAQVQGGDLFGKDPGCLLKDCKKC